MVRSFQSIVLENLSIQHSNLLEAKKVSLATTNYCRTILRVTKVSKVCILQVTNGMYWSVLVEMINRNKVIIKPTYQVLSRLVMVLIRTIRVQVYPKLSPHLNFVFQVLTLCYLWSKIVTINDRRLATLMVPVNTVFWQIMTKKSWTKNNCNRGLLFVVQVNSRQVVVTCWVVGDVTKSRDFITTIPKIFVSDFCRIWMNFSCTSPSQFLFKFENSKQLLNPSSPRTFRYPNKFHPTYFV